MQLWMFVAVVFAVISGVSALANALWGPRARARRRLRAGVRALADGEVVTLVGKVRAPTAALLTAPLSGRTCVGFESLVGAYEGTGLARRLKPRFAVREFVPFELETKHGCVFVDATSEISVALPPAPVIPRSLERERQFLAEHAAAQQLKESAFEEVCVLDGDVVAVQGIAMIEQVADARERGYRDVAMRARLVAHPNHPLTIGKA
jgi:hypothetical protein